LFSIKGILPRLSFDGWGLASFSVAALVFVPLSVVLSSLFSVNDEVWEHLVSTTLSRVLLNTLSLGVGVAIGTAFLGVSLAWLTAACDFPGRKVFDWALMLPMAIPAYVTAFVAIGFLDFTGPVRTTLRAWFGREYGFPEIRSRGGVILVMTLCLYPYVYLLARNAFLTQGRRALEVAQSLGESRWSGFFRVSLPMARPWIIGGVSLALMETLADFGAVSIFNYDTFATAIYKAWFGLFSLSAASQLASLLVLFVFVFLLIEQYATYRTRYTRAEKSGISGDRVRLSPIKSGLAFTFCMLILLAGFLLPLAQLLFWSRSVLFSDLDSRYFELLGHSLFLAAVAALITVTAVIILVYASRLNNTLVVRVMVRIATLGYALPGSVLAVGIFIPLAWLDTQLIAFFDVDLFLQGTLLAMFCAYLVRFLAVAHHPIQSAIQRISPSIDESSRNLGCGGWSMLRQIHLPIMRGGLMTGLVLVFVDVMKEMPITLMTRPFGWDTLSVRIFEMTSEGEWERAALPAVALVLAGLIPVIFLTKDRAKGF